MKNCSVILFFLFSLPLFAQEKTAGRHAPDFYLDDMEGNIVALGDITGKGPVIISFWATWCKPCIEELGELQKLYEEFKKANVSLLAISTDSERSLAKVKPFVKSRGYAFTVLLDTNSDVARKYYVQTIPYTLVLNAEGSIVYSHTGYKKGDEVEIRRVVEHLLTR